MKSLVIIFIFIFIFFSFSFLIETEAADAKKSMYIVYMGAAASRKGTLRDDHAQLLSTLFKRKTNSLVHNYKYGFSGFAALLSAEEASSISQRPGVVSVFPDPVLQLHTTRSWDFLKYQTSVEISSRPNSNSASNSTSSDTIIGILDTGIWPESESFNDKGMDDIPKTWKGICENAKDFNSSNCNRKLIGARSYGDHNGSVIIYNSPRDKIGHGTHVASTAAGSEVPGASYYGLAAGNAKGGSPSSRIAMYQVCANGGCQGSAILAAFDDAIADGVNVLSLSLGAGSFFKPDIIDDPIALGAFHAVENGITVVCSAGNDGPDSGSVVNAAPWILTVAASTIDRIFETDVPLGDSSVVVKGEGINFGNIEKSPVYPIIHAKSATKSGANQDDSRGCSPDSMDPQTVKGRIVVCDKNGEYSPIEQKDEVNKLGGVGAILIDDDSMGVATNFGAFPSAVISSKDGDKIIAYINSTKNAVATILPTTSPTKYTPAPSIAFFSARGPSTIPKNIIKPDIAAPGVDILAAWPGNDTDEAPEGKDPPLYNLLSGTSMSCPHVSGIAATVISTYSTWSPSAIKSAIMTTAIQINNLKAPITTEKSEAATPFDFGAGEVSITGPLQPGLVYETTTTDYLNFLCYHGYNISSVKTIARTVPDGFTCPVDSSIDLISNINYPSIAISNFNEKVGRKVNRTLTNVAGDDNTDYTVNVEKPEGLQVEVVPETLNFKKNGEKLSYQVSFSSTSTLAKDAFGSITWSNGKYKVRSPFAVSSTSGN